MPSYARRTIVIRTEEEWQEHLARKAASDREDEARPQYLCPRRPVCEGGMLYFVQTDTPEPSEGSPQDPLTRSYKCDGCGEVFHGLAQVLQAYPAAEADQAARAAGHGLSGIFRRVLRPRGGVGH